MTDTSNQCPAAKPVAIKPVDRYELGDAIRRAWQKHGQDSWCSIADDVLAELANSPRFGITIPCATMAEPTRQLPGVKGQWILAADCPPTEADAYGDSEGRTYIWTWTGIEFDQILWDAVSADMYWCPASTDDPRPFTLPAAPAPEQAAAVARLFDKLTQTRDGKAILAVANDGTAWISVSDHEQWRQIAPLPDRETLPIINQDDPAPCREPMAYQALFTASVIVADSWLITQMGGVSFKALDDRLIPISSGDFIKIAHEKGCEPHSGCTTCQPYEVITVDHLDDGLLGISAKPLPDREVG
jgi:hypothetical protein